MHEIFICTIPNFFKFVTFSKYLLAVLYCDFILNSVRETQSFLSITAIPTFLLDANKPSVFLNGKSVWPKKLTSSVLAWTFSKTHSMKC